MKNKKVAVIIVNYNMPERTKLLVEHFQNEVKHPHELIVVDNGSDLNSYSYLSTVRVEKNLQTTNGWLMGLAYADALEQVTGEPFFAYHFLITSARFPIGSGDTLAPMVRILDENVVAVHPALTPNSTTAWKHLFNRQGQGARRTWMIDNIASLWKADWFNHIGRFDPEMIYAWGIDLEMCYKARSRGKKIMILEHVLVEKETDIGYKMDRMGMDANERSIRASANMIRVMLKKYGSNWEDRMYRHHVKEDWK